MDEKTSKAVVACITWRHAALTKEEETNLKQTVARVMINTVFAVMKENSLSINELEYYHPDLKEEIGDICFLLSQDLITTKHAKEIFENVWNMVGLSAADYIIQSKLLNEAGGDELKSIVEKVLNDAPHIREQYHAGKTKAIGSLIGVVMKQCGGKANPAEVKNMLEELV